MPTIFERLTGALSENDVSVRVTVQSDNLTGIASTVAELIEHPPSELGDLSSLLQALPLPDLSISNDFTQSLSALSDAVPTDLSSLTGDLTGGLGELGSQLGELTGPLGKIIEVVLAVYAVTQVDLFCAPDGGASGGGGAPPPPPPPGDPPPGGQPPAATPPAVVQQLNGIIDVFPDPLTLDSLLNWLYLLLRDFDLSDFHIVQVPILDDIRDPLVTLVTWRNAMNTAELLGHMNDTLTLLNNTITASVDAVYTPIDTAISAINLQLPMTPLAQIADDLVTHLQTLRTAVLSGNLSTTTPAVTAINALLDTYTGIQLTVQNSLAIHFATLSDRLASLDTDLDDSVGRLVSLLQPESLFNFIPMPSQSALSVAGLGEFEEWMDSLIDWLHDLTDRLDLSAIQEPLGTVADSLQDVVESLDAAMITVTLQVQSLFGEVEDLLDQIDPGALLDEVQGAIDNFQQTLSQQLEDLFAPISEAIGGVITQISDGVDSFDPADIIDALRGAINALTGVLKHPEVLSAMKAIRDAIESTSKALEDVSFTPLADQVIAEIDTLTAAFEALDTSKLSTPVQLSLQAALAILPEDLTPISNPLVARLGELVVEGPMPLLQAVEQQPAILLNQIRDFSPGKLVGGALSAPYNALVTQMNAFKPSKLLEGADAELNTLKARLTESANPSQLLEPLQAPFDSLFSAFDQLSPETIVAPLENAIHDAISAVLDALPIDETFEQLDAVLAPIQRATQIGTDTITLLNRLVTMLNGLADPQAQMDAWIDAILTNVNNINDASSLQPAFDAIETALDGTTAVGLIARVNTGGLEMALTTLNPQVRIVSLIQAYNGVPRAQLEALADSPEKTGILAALNRFNPVDPAFVAPYQRAAKLQTALTAAFTKLDALFADWDSRYHEASPLAALRGLQATPENLRAWIGEALDEKAGRPIVAVLSMLAPMAEVLGTFISKLEEMVDALTGKLTALLEGPGSLGDIRDTIQALVDRLQNLNLDFLTQSIGAVFDNLRGKLEAISPAALGTIIDQAFAAMLDTLKIELLIPPAQIAQLDTAYQHILDGLAALDPEKLVVKVVQPEFETKIIPLLAVFDPKDVLDALYTQLNGIEDELRAEMARVNEAYQKMRDAVPSISISIDIDIDVDLPF